MRKELKEPALHDLIMLSRLVEGYPVSRDKLIWKAQEAHFGSNMIDFLERFPEDKDFLNIEDFIGECQDLQYSH